MSTVPDVIGEGTYGCVHKPSLTCTTTVDVRNKLSKFMLKDDAQGELNEYNIISEIDNNKQFYLGKPTMCVPKNSSSNNRAIEKCNLYKKNKKLNRSFALLVMKDGGKELSEYSTKRLRFLTNNSKTVHIIRDFWKESLRMFKGIILFKANGLLHHDLKPQNMVYNESKNRLNFIDFGFMRRIDDVIEACRNDKYYIADYAFWSYPFEFAYLNIDAYMKIARLTNSEKTNYYNHILKTLKTDKEAKISVAMRLFFDYITRNMTIDEKNATIDKYLEDFKNMIIYELVPDNYLNFLKKSVETIDVFGLGMAFQYVLNYCRDFISENAYSEFEDCFYNMMTPSVLNRYSAEYAIQKMQSILKQQHWYVGKTIKLQKYTKKSRSKIRHSDIFIDNDTRDKLIKMQEEIKEKHSSTKTKKTRKLYPQ